MRVCKYIQQIDFIIDCANSHSKQAKLNLAHPETYFKTTIPFRVAAERSMLSTPVPALPTTRRFDTVARISAVTFVSDLTIRASCFCKTIFDIIHSILLLAFEVLSWKFRFLRFISYRLIKTFLCRYFYWIFHFVKRIDFVFIFTFDFRRIFFIVNIKKFFNYRIWSKLLYWN